jgi:Tfp pilus assembly protein PilF
VKERRLQTCSEGWTFMTAIKVRHFQLVALLFLALCTAGCAMSEAAKKKASYHYQMGLSYLGENNVTGALVELTEAEKLNPDDPELLNYLGLAYYRKNKFELAEHKYLRALDLKPTYSEARNNLGVDYLELKRWDDAIYHLKMVTEDIFYPDHESASINLGLAYLGKGDYPKALSVLRAVVVNDPKNPRARVNLGKVYLALDKTELAIMEFTRAVALNKDYANAHYNLGLAYLKNKDNQAAVAAFREVLRINPDSDIGQLSREYIDVLK